MSLSIDPVELPADLVPVVEHGWQRFGEALERIGHRPDSIAVPEGFARELARVWAASNFVSETCIRNPELLLELLASGDLQNDYAAGVMKARVAAAICEAADPQAMRAGLRRARRREMLRIVWRDLAFRTDFFATVRDTTELADCAIAQTEAWLHARYCEKYGVPRGPDASAQRMVVVGMGKLGAGELNVSSDVDLMFFYPQDGATDGGRLENQQFFTRLGRELISLLSDLDADGFVFRVDMRLRPYGQSGALALSFDAADAYYQEQGREWERYAMIKARVIAGDMQAGEEFLLSLRPFVYRRYLDYGAFESLRNMKGLINSEVRRRGLEDDVKLGLGGIREVEFIVQAFQLIRGGRDQRLQDPRLWPVLEMLAEDGLLPFEVVRELQEAYVFLRNTEHAIQGLDDRQTQALPADSLDLQRVAWGKGYRDVQAFLKDLQHWRERVHGHFSSIIEPETGEAAGESQQAAREWISLWQSQMSAAPAWLESAGFADPEAVLALLAGLRADAGRQKIGEQARERLDHCMPLLLQALAASDLAAPERLTTLRRLLQLVRQVLRRSVYLVLLVEKPVAMQQAIRLFAASPWIADEIADTPALLEELVNRETLYTPPDRETLQDELRQHLLRVLQDDEERQMDCLRYFRQAHLLRIAASELAGSLPLMKVSDYLTWLAEVILDEVLALSWDYMLEKHGRPGASEGHGPDFLILGYGKLGGLELGYGSDLDLVFLHDADASLASEGDREGRRRIDNATYFIRLGQRILHVLGTRTLNGVLYDVDMRLRPNGNSGMLAVSIAAFETYLAQDAWTWEHQALVRARPVAGGRNLARRFAEVRSSILRRERDLAVLGQEVRDMRDKMRSALGSSSGAISEEQKFDLKQDQGAIVDIEFMVQYAVLAWSNEHAELVAYSDNIRILENLAAAGLLSESDAALLTDAYKAYRAAAHRQALQNEPASVAVAGFETHRVQVSRIWQLMLGTAPAGPDHETEQD